MPPLLKMEAEVKISMANAETIKRTNLFFISITLGFASDAFLAILR
jgi:hypothetical protein